MVERLEYDPEKNQRPDFASDVYGIIRNALIGDADSPALDDESAIQYLQEQWEISNQVLKDRYRAQVLEEQQLMETRRQENAEAELLKEQEIRAKESELAKEAEKRRTPLYVFQKGQGITAIPPQLHPYAKKMIMARKYVPLWYFLPEASAEAKEKGRDALDTNRFQITKDENDGDTSSSQGLTLVSTQTTRASPNAIPDSRLTWTQVMRAKSTFLSSLPIGSYPTEFIEMFAGFYTSMDMHPELREVNGEVVMAHYHAEMRSAWYDANERTKPFDLAIISTEVMEESRRAVRKAEHQKAVQGGFIIYVVWQKADCSRVACSTFHAFVKSRPITMSITTRCANANPGR
ncbi:hypothetical protein D9757_011847 [Collybiopsis confluens]|uniref:Uncharacterized protein n=1 Tax=Collybiopsis confluens TaxID=2823264 RepID=A0A8H5H0L0_9AGAR|nr:hypothetical protein D9757_011847 [Collybiopsis confluens]